MALPVTDTFTSGSTQALTAYSAAWSYLEGSFDVVAPAGFQGSSFGYNTARRNDETFAADQYSQVVVTASGSNYPGPAVRCQSGSNTSYHCETDGGGTVYLSKCVGGTQSTLTSWSQAVAANDVLRLEVEGTGATVTLRVYLALAATPTSFSLVGSFGDTAGDRITTAGQAGIFEYANSVPGAVVGKTWSAGNLAGVAPTVTADPVGSAAAVGGTTQYAIAATGATSYQWQSSSDRGQTWASVSGGSGGTTATYTTPAAAAADNGLMYRCAAINANGTTYSGAAFFHVSGIGTKGMGAHPSGLLVEAAWELRGERTASQSPGVAIAMRALSGSNNRDFATAARARFFADPPPTPLAPWPGRRQAEVRLGFGAPLQVRRMRGAPPVLLLATTARTATFSLDAAVQVAQALAASVGAAVQAPQSASSVINLAVQQALTAQASIDAALQIARTAAASIDAALQQARSTSANADLSIQAGRTTAASADVGVQIGRSATASLDTYVQAATALAASIDLLVQDGHALSVAVELAIQASRTASSDVNLAVQLARTAVVNVDTAVQAARSALASVDVAVQAARTAGVAVDLYVQTGFALVVSIDTAVRFSVSAAAAVDTAVQLARSATCGLSAVVSVQRVLAAAMAAAVQASASTSASLNLYVSDPSAFTYTADGPQRVGPQQLRDRIERIGPRTQRRRTSRIG